MTGEDSHDNPETRMARLLLSASDCKLEDELAAAAMMKSTGSGGGGTFSSTLLAAALLGGSRPALLVELLLRGAAGGGIGPSAGLTSVHASSKGLLGASTALQVRVLKGFEAAAG